MLDRQNHAAGEANGSIMVGMFVCLCLASKKPSKQEFFVPAGMDLGVKLLRKTQLDKLEVFLHRSIRHILHISMTKVYEQHLHNDNVRKMFYSIPCVRNMIAARQMDFVGKMVCGPPDRPSRNMITACCDHKRRVGRPQTTGKNFMVENLRLSIPGYTHSPN